MIQRLTLFSLICFLFSTFLPPVFSAKGHDGSNPFEQYLDELELILNSETLTLEALIQCDEGLESVLEAYPSSKRIPLLQTKLLQIAKKHGAKFPQGVLLKRNLRQMTLLAELNFLPDSEESKEIEKKFPEKNIKKKWEELIKGYQENQFGKGVVVVSIPVSKNSNHIYDILGQSENTRLWSVFVHHITDLSGVPGSLNSIRRCFREEKQKGIQWDEELLSFEPGKKRTIKIFNPHGFLISSEKLLTEQVYQMITPEVTLLSFTLFFNREIENPGLIDKTKLLMAKKRVKDIFEKNLENIKILCEKGKENYLRKHPFKAK